MRQGRDTTQARDGELTECQLDMNLFRSAALSIRRALRVIMLLGPFRPQFATSTFDTSTFDLVSGIRLTFQ